VRSELQAAENSNAEVVKNPNEEAAIANVRSSYVYLMTHPYSIDSLRDSEERLKLDLQALEEIIGEEKANNILDNLKRELAPSFKGRTTPKIKYDGILDKFTDIVRTKISDWWD
jgi:chaperonin cofactor prefoldin